MSLRPCTESGCPNLIERGNSRCEDCRLAYARQLDKRRDTNRGYASPGHRRFRRQVLDRDPLCVLCGDVATIADHFPKSRRELIDAGLDPNDPKRGRGLCKSCHDRETAAHQPGGWNYR